MSCLHCLALAEQLAELKAEIAAGRAARLDRAFVIGQRLGLPRQESIILTALYDAKGRVLTKEQIDEALPEPADGLARTWNNLTVRIYNIRQKAGFHAIASYRAFGWSITDLGRIVCEEALEAQARAA